MHPIIPLLQLVNTVKRIEGRKKLQKTVHILKELGVPFAESFEYSFYGMYSLQLKNEVNVLVSENLLREQPQTVYGGHTSFVIESTLELEKLVAEFDLALPPEWAPVALHLNSLSPQILEGISTILFLRRTETSVESIRRHLLLLKPHLKDLADACFAEVSGLRVPASSG